LVWALRNDAARDSRLLLCAASVFVLGLIADACQYAVLSYSWERHLRRKQAQLQKEHGSKATEVEFALPRSVNRAGTICFWVKACLMLSGLAAVLVYIIICLFLG